MNPLDDKQTKELFMFHAFGNANHVATKDFENKCMKIIKACGGLPLSLKVLGSSLCNTKELEIWEGALNKLKSGKSLTGGNDNEELWSKLRNAYDHLDKEHQTCFWILFFFGWFENKYNVPSVEWRSFIPKVWITNFTR